MISVTIFFFRSRSVFARIAKIHFEGNAYISFRVEVWNFRLKKTNYVWKDQVFFFFFLFKQRIKEKFRKHTEIAKPNNGEAKPRGPLCGEKGERARANLYTREREANESSSSLCRNCTRGGMLGGTRTRVNKEVHAYTYSAHGK